jgi:hypothetical protein
MLAEFQRLGWPPVIDDPLPHHPGDTSEEVHERLYRAVRRLNGKLQRKGLRFRKDGRRVWWEFCEAGPD